MIILLKLILLTSIWVLGLTIVTQPKMGLYRLRMFAEDQHATIYDPIILCEWCMPSLHSVIGYLFGFGIGICGVFEWKYLMLYPLVAMGSSLLCGITWVSYQMISSIYKNFKLIDNEE